MGGYLAMEMLEDIRKDFTGIGLIHSHVYADTEEKESRRKAIRFVGENEQKGLYYASLFGIVCTAY